MIERSPEQNIIPHRKSSTPDVFWLSPLFSLGRNRYLFVLKRLQQKKESIPYLSVAFHTVSGIPEF
ncbi:MAG: hypothetical protein AAFY26_03770 [Cyanobacteria bacterium J06638_22]